MVSDLLLGQLYKSPNSSKSGYIETATKSTYSENAYLISYIQNGKLNHATIEVVL